MKLVPRSFPVLLIALTTISCQLSYESTFHKDKTISSQITMTIDEKMLEEINVNNENPDSSEPRKFNGLAKEELPEDWTTFYDLKKKSGEPLPTDPDSLRILRSAMIKFDTDESGLKGFSMKINRAREGDMKRFGELFKDMNPGNDAGNQNDQKLTMMDMKWDGEKLVIPTGEDPVAKEMNNPERDTTATKAQETLNFFRTAFKGANFVITYTFKFEDKIKEIKGSHDLLKQLDKRTLEFKVDMLEIMEAEAGGKTFNNMDEEIVIYVK